MFNINNTPVKVCNVVKKKKRCRQRHGNKEKRKKHGDRQTRFQSMSHSIWKDGKHKYSEKFNKIYLKNINISFFYFVLNIKPLLPGMGHISCALSFHTNSSCVHNMRPILQQFSAQHLFFLHILPKTVYFYSTFFPGPHTFRATK